MMALLTILISALYVTILIRIFNKYAYEDDYPIKKVHIPNIVKIFLYFLCLLPYFNMIITFIGVTFISVSNYKWRGWEENKLLYWLFKA